MINKKLLAAGIGTSMVGTSSCKEEPSETSPKPSIPLVISTWGFGQLANAAAWNTLQRGGNALDAVEQGVRLTESDANNLSVGIGGLPDRDGHLTLDACIMDSDGNCGSVAFLEGIDHPISVARNVMERTPHVMLVGAGAKKFALSQGFKNKDLSTEKSRKEYNRWKEKSEYKPIINSERHDTIGMLAIDDAGNISGACTTSGMAYKMHGRVGDSPIIGAGLYLDNSIGAAVATGLGEEIIRVAGASMIVELIRNGASPQTACEEMVNRVINRNHNLEGKQVCFIAVNKNGEVGGYSLYKGFQYALKTEQQDVIIDTAYDRLEK